MNKKEIFCCPVCPEIQTHQRLAFYHFIWKHPFEYHKLKHSNFKRSEMVSPNHSERAKGILQGKTGPRRKSDVEEYLEVDESRVHYCIS